MLRSLIDSRSVRLFLVAIKEATELFELVTDAELLDTKAAAAASDIKFKLVKSPCCEPGAEAAPAAAANALFGVKLRPLNDGKGERAEAVEFAPPPFDCKIC